MIIDKGGGRTGRVEYSWIRLYRWNFQISFEFACTCV